MSWELYKKLIDELSALGHVINLGLNFGGESLLHDKFIDMLDYAASKKVFRIGFTTNGMLLNDDIVEAIVDNEIDNITVSLDGLREKHESIRVGSNYNIVERNIINLVEKRANRTKPTIAVNLIASEHTSHDITKFINHWVGIVDYVQIAPCLSEDLWVIKSAFFDQFPTKINRCCYRPFYYLAILWNGDVTTCCYDINGVNVLGNVTAQRIVDLWKSKTFILMRYAALTNTFQPQSLCYKCNAWQTEFSPFSKQIGKVRVQSSGGLSVSYKLITF